MFLVLLSFTGGHPVDAFAAMDESRLSTTHACGSVEKLNIPEGPIAGIEGVPECLCGVIMGGVVGTVTGLAETALHPIQDVKGLYSFAAHPVEDVESIKVSFSSNMKNFQEADPAIKTALVCDAIAQVVLFGMPVAAATKVTLLKDAAEVSNVGEITELVTGLSQTNSADFD
jgi:hypothetical protein